MEQIPWESIADLGGNMLDNIGSDVVAKKMFLENTWKGLENANLTLYQTELEKHIVYIRFLVIYEIMAIFFEKIGFASYYPSYEDYIYDFEMSEIRIGQLLNEKLSHESFEDILELSIESIVKDTEEQVIRCLLVLFEGIHGLFAALYLALVGKFENPEYYFYYDEDLDIEEYIEISTMEEYRDGIKIMVSGIMKNVTFEKLVAFDWLKTRCNI